MKRFIRPHAGLFACTVLFAVAAGGLAVLVQFTKGSLLDTALQGEGGLTLRLAALLLLIIAAEITCYYLSDRFRGKYYTRAKAALREAFFRAQLRKTPPQMTGDKQGDILAAYTDQVDTVCNNYLFNLPLLFDVVLKIILVSAALFWLDVRVALLTLALLTTPLYVPKIIEGRLQQAQSETTAAFQAHLGQVAEWLSGFELIKNYGAEVPILDRFLTSNQKLREKDYAMRKLSYLSRTLSTILSYLSHFIILAYSAWLVVSGAFSAGDFFIAVGMIDQLSYPIITISIYLQEIIAARPINNKLLSEIDTGDAAPQAQTPLGELTGIAFDQVGFGFEAGRPLLRDFSLQVSPHEKCLITGPSGSGKTTLMNLLVAYYPPDRGTVTISGVPASHIANLNSLITIMRQEPVLFQDSLRNNLCFYQDFPDDALTSILSRLGLHRFANPQGLDYAIEEGGKNLSGGERKRICLARTLLRRTPILILDEPLANVDPDTARMIENTIASLEDTTLFVISHQVTAKWERAFEKRVTLKWRLI